MKHFALVAAAALCLPAFAYAQAEGGPPPGPPPMAHRGFGGPGGPGMGPLAMGMMHRVVTGAPYSATITTSTQQTLPDGNTISRTETGQVARDSQGRVYMQQNVVAGPWAQKGPMTVTFLSDPVAGYVYVLNAKNKTAVRRTFQAKDGARPPAEPGSEPGGQSNRVQSDLGQQTIEGLAASGKGITRTIPAGAIGNAQPIVAKSEIWTSPDLQIVLLAKHSDPRMGQTTYSLSNIQRSEPNAALFQVPAGYTVEDAPAHGPWGAK